MQKKKIVSELRVRQTDCFHHKHENHLSCFSMQKRIIENLGKEELQNHGKLLRSVKQSTAHFCTTNFIRKKSSSNVHLCDTLDPRLNVLESILRMRFVSLSHSIEINETIIAHLWQPHRLYQSLWTSTYHNRIFMIFGSSSKGFRYSIGSHPVKIKMHFYTHSFKTVLNMTTVSNERSEFWRRSPKNHASHTCRISDHIYQK